MLTYIYALPSVAAMRRGWSFALLATALLAPCAASAQESGAERFEAYVLRHAQAADLEPQLSRLMAGLPVPAEVVVDPRSNRLLVRGNVQAQQMAAQLLGTLDRPAVEAPQPAAPAAASGPVLKAYASAPDQLAGLTTQLQTQFANRGDVRIAADARTSQLLVFAPPDVQGAIARQLTGQQVGNPQPAQPALAAPELAAPQPSFAPAGGANQAPAARSFALRFASWQQVEGKLAELYGERFNAAQSVGGEISTCEMAFPGKPLLQLTANHRTNQIELRGGADQVESCVRLLQLLDAPPAPPGQSVRAIPVSQTRQDSVRRAVQAIQTPAGGPALGAAGGMSSPLASRLFQQAPVAAQPSPAAGQPNAPPPTGPMQALPGQAPAGDPNAAAGDNTVSGGLVGPVQIEFVEDLIIVRGNEKDVQRVLQIIEEIEKQNVPPDIDVHYLKHSSSEAVASIINALYDQVFLPRQGRVNITALIKPNALLLIGRTEAVKTVKDLVDRLDQPVPPSSRFAVFPLKHATASSVQTTITTLYPAPAANSTTAGLTPRVVVTTDFRTNTVIVQAAPRDLEEVGELIARIDASTSESEQELRLFPLQNSLADELAPILTAAISAQSGGGGGGLQAAAQNAAGSNSGRSTMLRFETIDNQGQRRLRSGILADVKITADPRANALLVSAPSESMELIGALIKQLDQIPAAESQIKVFTIVNGDAASLTQMLQGLFGAATTAGGGAFGGGGANQANQLVNAQGENPLVPLRFSTDARTNSIIASGSGADLNVVEAILLRLDASDAQQRKSVVYRLKNSPAQNVSDAVNNFLRSEREVQNLQQDVVSPFEQIEREVVVVPEIVSNSLIVSATPRYFEEIRQIVEELDARPPMVMVQVLIAEVKLNNTDEFGVELGLQDSILFDRSLISNPNFISTSATQAVPGGGTITSNTQTVLGADNTPGYNFNNTLPLGSSGSTNSISTRESLAGQALTNLAMGRSNGNLGFGGLVLSASNESISILIRALQECRRLEVLSRPQIMTLDNQAAYIQVGQRVSRISGATINQFGQTNTVADVNVGLILGVTPRISPDGLVVMLLDAEKSALGPESEGVPITTSTNGQIVRSPNINTTTASTTVSAVSGQTIVLGGLITKTKSATRRRIPLLASIPVLGNLFRYDLEIVERTELLIIMTPHVVRSEADATKIKQTEAARMSWCLGDVRKMHGDAGLENRNYAWGDGDTMVVYPDQNPGGVEMIPSPEGGMINGQPLPPGGSPLPAEAPGPLVPSESTPANGPQPTVLPQPPGGGAMNAPSPAEPAATGPDLTLNATQAAGTAPATAAGQPPQLLDSSQPSGPVRPTRDEPTPADQSRQFPVQPIQGSLQRVEWRSGNMPRGIASNLAPNASPQGVQPAANWQQTPQQPAPNQQAPVNNYPHGAAPRQPADDRRSVLRPQNSAPAAAAPANGAQSYMQQSAAPSSGAQTAVFYGPPPGTPTYNAAPPGYGQSYGQMR